MSISSIQAPGESQVGPSTSIEGMLQRLRESGIQSVLDVLDGLLEQGIAPSSEQFLPVLFDVSGLLLAQFHQDTQSAEAYGVLKRMNPPLARAIFDVLMRAKFPEGNPDVRRLNEPTILVLAGLLSAANAHYSYRTTIPRVLLSRSIMTVRNHTRPRAAPKLVITILWSPE